MDGLDLTDAWQRWAWAERNAADMHALLSGFVESHPYTTWVHQDGDRWYWTFLRATNGRSDEEAAIREAEVLDQAAMLWGQTLDHLRGALNYLIYQVALLSIREDPSLEGKVKPESIEFPIFNDQARYRRENRVKALPEKHRVRLEAIQPYHGHHQGLWKLHELARQYRHRVIQPVACVTAGDRHAGLFIEDLPDTFLDVEVIHQGGPLKHNQDLLSFVTAPGTDPHLYPNPAFSIGVDHPLVSGLDYTKLLLELRVDVMDTLEEFLGGDVPGMNELDREE